MQRQSRATRGGRGVRRHAPIRWAILAFTMMAALPSLALAEADTLYNASYAGGAFAHLTGNTWVENTWDGTTAYEEYDRDEWSVYLHANGDSFAIDIWQNKIKKWSNGAFRPIHDITSINTANGYTATAAKVDVPGVFAETGVKEWTEFTGKTSRKYREIQRDEWSVYLAPDGFSGPSILLDYYQKKVRNWANGAALYNISNTGGTTGCRASSKDANLNRDIQDFGAYGMGEFSVKCVSGKPQLGGRLFSLVRLFGSTFEVGEIDGYVRDGEAGVNLRWDGWLLASHKLVGEDAVDGPLTIAEPLYTVSKKKRFVYAGLNFDITASGAVVAGARDVRPVVVKTGVGTVVGFSGEAYLNATARLSAYVASIFASAGLEASIKLAELALPASFAGIANDNGGMDGPYGDLKLRVEVMSNGRLKAKGYVMGFSTTFFDIHAPTVFSATYPLL